MNLTNANELLNNLKNVKVKLTKIIKKTKNKNIRADLEANLFMIEASFRLITTAKMMETLSEIDMTTAELVTLNTKIKTLNALNVVK